jgi:hypothetical protein
MEVDFSDDFDKDTDLVCRILFDKKLLSVVEKTGFTFDNVVSRGTAGTVHDLMKHLTYEGRRLHLTNHRDVRENIYNVWWVKQYSESIALWRDRIAVPVPKSAVLEREYEPAFSPWAGNMSGNR